MKNINLSKFNIIQKLFTSIVALILALHCLCINAFAFNESYMDISKWTSSQNVSSQTIHKNGAGGDLDGSISYFVDDEEYCLYIWLNLYNDYITPSSTNYVNFEFSNAKESYLFSVDGNGIVDQQEQSYFVANSNFENKNGYASYIVAVDINNGSNENVMKLSVNLDGAKYIIAKDIVLTKAEPPTTTKVTKAKTTKKHTTKAKSSSKSKSKSKANTYTTKFRLDTSENDDLNNSVSNAPTQQYIPKQPQKAKFATKSIVAIIVLSLGTALGISLIIASIVLSKKQKNQE